MTEKTQAFILIALSVVAASLLCAIGKLDPHATTAIIGGAIVAARGVISPGLRQNGRGPLGLAIKPKCQNGQHKLELPQEVGEQTNSPGQAVKVIDVNVDESFFRPTYPLGPVVGMLAGALAPEIGPFMGMLW